MAMIIHSMHTSSSDIAAKTTLDSLNFPPQFSGTTALKHLGVIRVEGEEGAKFLQGQLTQDVMLMGMTDSRLAAFCNAKGRMQASFVIFRRSQTEILLVCSRDLLAQTLKRLSMFVMRAKAKLSDASEDFLLLGVAGQAVQVLAGSEGLPWSKVDHDLASLVRLYPAKGHARALWCAPSGSAMPDLGDLPLAVWNWLEVNAGVATLTQPVFEAFVPQMLNYESVGGVSFKKGCYPGQEIIARSQFRGTLKRRAYLIHGQTELVVGQEVFKPDDAEQACGTVVAWAACPSADEGFDAIVSMQTSAAADGLTSQLRLGSANGQSLSLLPLPYELLEDL
ncbi:tRNA-modifying protein YgfZ [Polaromonas vacuolata]|uniref:tRNA-modifying protein YgfZ n=2 Tax=Polaromonas vacuolata TaxID=37448 RepID=A0A6H2H9V2_9BURK|nr:folate-binding protein [Polaromonas vacuolata]QJC56374.1 tRNA-modifying protein YgfZ [Polaromonas vacuolata]